MFRRGRVVALRRLSTVAAETAEEAPGPWSRRMRASGAVAAALGLPGATGLFYVTNRFGTEEEYRKWMRSGTNTKMVAQFIESNVLDDYFPRLAHNVRVQDDALAGDGTPNKSSEPLMAVDLGEGPVNLNLGSAPFPTAPLNEAEGGRFYLKLVQTASAPVAEADATEATTPTTGAAPSLSAARPRAEPHVRVPEPASASVAVDIGPIAPDDEEDLDLDQPGHAWDGARWSDGKLSEPGAWAFTPPEQPERLAVSGAAAAKFEEALEKFDVAVAALRGQDVQPLLARQASAAQVRDRTARRMIQLPPLFRDDAFGTEAAELPNLSSAPGPALSPDPHAWREVRLQWLRVQRSYAEAEAELVEARFGALAEAARKHEGGGNALLNVAQRRRQLHVRLASIAHEMKTVKRARSLEIVVPSSLDVVQ